MLFSVIGLILFSHRHILAGRQPRLFDESTTEGGHRGEAALARHILEGVLWVLVDEGERRPLYAQLVDVVVEALSHHLTDVVAHVSAVST